DTVITTLDLGTNAGGDATSCVATPALPTGLTAEVNGASPVGCQITGTPTVITTATDYTITASNTGGNDTSPTVVNITVNDVVPDLTNVADQVFVKNDVVSFVFPTSGGGDATGCGTPTPALPTGLGVTVDTSTTPDTCKISGTVTGLQLTQITHTITATNSGGGDSTPATVKIIVNPLEPTIISLTNLTYPGGASPKGSTAGGSTITITGTNFKDGTTDLVTAVNFASTNATSYTIDSATQITAVAPSGTTGAVNVSATTAGGVATSTNGFNYIDSCDDCELDVNGCVF
ncbi:MAG: hypothetical protein DRQ51_10785, partial [Gammaproteobacteria bacterium]